MMSFNCIKKIYIFPFDRGETFFLLFFFESSKSVSQQINLIEKKFNQFAFWRLPFFCCFTFFSPWFYVVNMNAFKMITFYPAMDQWSFNRCVIFSIDFNLIYWTYNHRRRRNGRVRLRDYNKFSKLINIIKFAKCLPHYMTRWKLNSLICKMIH